MSEREFDEDGRELPPIELYPGVSIDGGWQVVDESTAEAATRYFEHNPDGMTPPGFKRSDEGLRATDLRICYTDEMGFMANAQKCPACGDVHDYTPKECENFLTFGQGGADFEESQRLAALYDEEADASA